MTALVDRPRSAGYQAGWILLMTLSVLSALNHLILTFVLDDPVLFIGWAAFNIYAILVLYFPFRQGQSWAWYATWVQVAGFASLIFFDAAIGVYYVSAAALMAAGLLLTRSAFFRNP